MIENVLVPIELLYQVRLDTFWPVLSSLMSDRGARVCPLFEAVKLSVLIDSLKLVALSDYLVT
jgi:hypothetical protein